MILLLNLQDRKEDPLQGLSNVSQSALNVSWEENHCIWYVVLNFVWIDHSQSKWTVICHQFHFISYL